VGTNNSHRYFLNFAYTRSMGASMLNEFRVTAQRANNLQAVPSSTLGTPQSFGTTVTPDNPTGPPLITFPALTIGFSPQGPSNLIDNTFGYTDTFTWTRGKHTMKFGGGFSAFQDNQVFDFFVNGNFDFLGTLDGTTPFGAGDPFANFLVGIPDFFFQAPAAPSNIRGKTTYVFGQDEWHVASNLVLTLGLRYEYNSPKLDTKGRTFSVVPGAQSTVFPNAPVGILFPGDKGAPVGANFPNKTNFAPRLGFAWQPFNNAKTSVRGGFGVFYDILKAEDNFQFNGQFPFAATSFIGFNDPSGTAGPFGLVTDPFGSTGSPNPFPSKPIDHNISFVNNVGTFGGAGVFFVDPKLRTPYTYQFNLSIEHELARKMAVSAAYVGSSSHGLTGLKDINPFDPATINTPNPVRILNETPGNTPTSLGFLPQFMNVANANYHAVQLSLRQQSTAVPILGNMYYTLGYTYAHSIDDSSGFRNFNSQVPFFQPQLFRASSDFDLRHVLTFSGGWDLPFNRGPKRLVKGWSLYPILSWRTGFPLTVNGGLNSLNGDPGPSGAGDATLVNTDLVAPVHYLDPHKQQTINGATGFFFYDPTSFAAATSGYGTAPRNLLRGPGRTNMDLSLGKVTPLVGDRLNLKLSVDAFNVFNHTEFRTLSGNFSSSRVGQAISTYDPRILQLSAHVNF
jgi:TonB dependent receptor